MPQPVTAWFCFIPRPGGTALRTFNHIEDGHSPRNSPEPRFPAQRWWPDAVWNKEYGVLSDGQPPKLIFCR